MGIINDILVTPLQYEKALEYYTNCLQNGNILACELLKTNFFHKGNFFAVTSKFANLDKINNFHEGGLLSLQPLEKMIFHQKEYAARKKSSSVNELAIYLCKKLSDDSEQECWFEDVTQKKSDANFSKGVGDVTFYNENVYFFLKGKSCSFENAIHLIQLTDAQWYYMNLITQYKSNIRQKELSLSIIQEIVAGTTIIVVGAYDMEGFVCWERTIST